MATKKAANKAVVSTKEKKAPRGKRVVKEDVASKENNVIAFDPYAHLDKDLDTMEKKFGLSAMAISKNEPRFSTGLLSLDILLAGGLLGGGWYTFFGGEQSCKSTLAMTVLASIMQQKDFLGKSSYWDYEGSTQAEYIENIMRGMGVKSNVENVFGIQDEATGDWIVPPKVRYYSPDVGEKFFNYLAKLEKMLPDKVMKGGSWWYVYDNTRDNQKALKGKYDKGLFSKTNQFYVPAADGSIQAILLCDSYPAMLTNSDDEKEEGDNSLALQARMFSKHIKRVKGNMRRKRVVVLGINQLRKIPMAMYGPTEGEPCGEALKFYSDVRVRVASCALSAAGAKGKGVIETEESVQYSGDDQYRYIRMRTFKNKLGGIPNQEIIMRLTVENANGDATGFCRTWDAYTFLKLTGQVTKTGTTLKFSEGFDVEKRDAVTGKSKTIHHDFKSPLGGMKLNWLDFKTLIQGHKGDIKELCTSLGLKKPILFRNFLAKQMSSRSAYTYMQDFKRVKAATKKAKDAPPEFDEDDEE